MNIAGYIAAIFIGISLGLIGGGGSILTVPVLVYLFRLDTLLATAYSLFIVGISSVVGSYSYLKKGLVHLPTVGLFGIPSIVAVFLTRAFVVPVLPQQLFTIHYVVITKSMLLMLLFAVLMVFASYSMIKKCQGEDCFPANLSNTKKTPVVFHGFFVGIVTGLIGAGGGFLIIPALVNLLKLPIKTAIGTSLVIIAINSLIGFAVSASHLSINWVFLLSISFMAIVGILIGSYLSTKIAGEKLKPAFGWFVLAMGIYIILKETFLK